MLQDCHLLSPPGIRDEEIAPRFDAILRSLSSWIGKSDVLLHAFELLSMVADRPTIRKRAVLVGDGQLIYFVKKAMARHPSSIPLQRAALQLFEAIIENVVDKRHLRSVTSAIFRSVLDNLIVNEGDLSIAFSSLSIMVSLRAHAKEFIDPWSDQLISTSISLISCHSSPELAAKCLTLISMLSVNNETLYTIVNHQRGLMVFVDALHCLNANHLPAAILALEIVWRILDDVDISMAAFLNVATGLSAVQFAVAFQMELKFAFDRFLSLVADTSDSQDDEVQYLFLLHSNIEETITVMLGHSDAMIAASQQEPYRPSQTVQPRQQQQEQQQNQSLLNFEDKTIDLEPTSTLAILNNSNNLRQTTPAQQLDSLQEIEGEYLPIDVKLSKDVIVTTAIDCDILGDDVVLPDDTMCFEGRIAPSFNEDVTPSKELEGLQHRLRTSVEGCRLEDVAEKLGRKPIPRMETSVGRKKRVLDLSKVVAIDNSEQGPHLVERKQIEELVSTCCFGE
jgi:hypothetical protein